METSIEATRRLDIRHQQESECTNQNWMVRVNNELHSNSLPLDERQEEQKTKNHLQLLSQAEQYYKDIGDDFNLFRLQLKKGNLQEAEKLAKEFLNKTEETNFLAHYTSQTEEMDQADILELKKAYILIDLADYKKDVDLRARAAKKFIAYAEKQSEREDLSGYEASALGFWQARRLVPKNERQAISTKCIDQFRKVANNRAQVGDRWWESIALRQIGKISTEPADKEVALKRAEELIEEYKKRGDYKKAALWARDVNDLNPSTENAARMEELWNKNIKRMQEQNDTRAIGKSFWSLYKRVKKYDLNKAEFCRLEAIEWYEKLLAEERSKNKPREDRIRECYWVFSELIK